MNQYPRLGAQPRVLAYTSEATNLSGLSPVELTLLIELGALSYPALNVGWVLHKIIVTPRDPRLLPDPRWRVLARRRLLDLLPDASLRAETYENLVLIARSGPRAPRCRGCGQRVFGLQPFSLPLDDPLRRPTECCGTEMALDVDLQPEGEPGYARFVLEAWSRRRPPRVTTIRSALAEELGCEIAVRHEIRS
jgi:hypothetical protein